MKLNTFLNGRFPDTLDGTGEIGVEILPVLWKGHNERGKIACNFNDWNYSKVLSYIFSNIYPIRWVLFTNKEAEAPSYYVTCSGRQGREVVKPGLSMPMPTHLFLYKDPVRRCWGKDKGELKISKYQLQVIWDFYRKKSLDQKIYLENLKTPLSTFS